MDSPPGGDVKASGIRQVTHSGQAGRERSFMQEGKSFRSLTLSAVLFLAAAIVQPARSQAPGDIEVVLESNESLRSLAQKHLGDANEWGIILYYNHLKSAEELKTGQRLWIPVQQVSNLNRLITECQRSILSANAEGAGILATLKVESAVEKLTRAVSRRKEADLPAATAMAEEALRDAGEALAIAREKRLQSVTAVLSEKKGTVQYHRLGEFQWQEAVLRQDLIEKDRVRTLSRSYGNILFVDGSRVQMDENALVVIETVNKDIIRNASSVELVVLEGDVSAWLNALHANPDFKLNSPGVDTKIRSRNFLTSRDKEKTTRFSNFDGEMDVIASGQAVTLADNEGTQVAYGKEPASPQKLLESPVPVHPTEGLSLPKNRIAFRWGSVDKASAYLIQISRDRSFTRIEKIMRTGRVETADWEATENGEYYWRIRAVDAGQLQGPFSKSIAFSVRVDRTPPFLALTSPVRDTVVFEAALLLRGRVETGARVMINGEPASSEGGRFERRMTLMEGRQQVVVSAVDEAGNLSKMVREIYCNTSLELITLEGGMERRVNVNRVSLRGTIKPQVRLEIQGRTVETQGGSFTHLLTLAEGSYEVAVKAESPDGHVQQQILRIHIDQTPPAMQIHEIPPFTDQPAVRLTGSLSEPAELTVDGKPVDSAQQRFSIDLQLEEGSNSFLLQSRDQAGNLAEKAITLTRDTEPPRILSHSLSAKNVTGGEIVKLNVEARDSGVGMARTCTAIVAIDPTGTQLSTLLKLNTETRGYEGSLSIPPDNSGSLKLVKLYVSDYLGNSATAP